MSVAFTAVLEEFNSRLWKYHIKVPAPIAARFIEGKDRRVICRLNDALEFQCALMPKGEGVWFINLNKEIRTKLGLTTGKSVEVTLRKDTSEYGLPMPAELATLLELDDEGRRLFEALPPGRKRNLLYIVGKPKTEELRLQRAVVVVEHLKRLNGKIDFRVLNREIRGG